MERKLTRGQRRPASRPNPQRTHAVAHSAHVVVAGAAATTGAGGVTGAGSATGAAGTTGIDIRERLAGRSDVEILLLDESRRKDAAARREAEKAAKTALRERERPRPVWATLRERKKVAIAQTMDRGRECRSGVPPSSVLRRC